MQNSNPYSKTFKFKIKNSILALVPPWVRVYRVQRDIPMPLVTSGVEKGNLRELVSDALEFDFEMSMGFFSGHGQTKAQRAGGIPPPFGAVPNSELRFDL